jgi:hydrogenase maturation factor
LSVVSRKINVTPLALSSEGELLLNVAMSDAPRRLDALLAFAERTDGEVFIGVVLGGRELAFVTGELGHAVRDATARVVGQKQRKRATSSRRRPSSL